ncbi:MAG TPA: hypothetical protein VK826_07260, partial [Bacteroidia bacterium]|nr:hypothetical protein [Bacteroidia bacterium]
MRVLFLLLCCIFSLSANAYTTRAGHIWVEAQSSNMYVLHAELLLSAPPAATDSFRLDWGNMAEQVYPMSSYPCTYSGGAYVLSIQKQHGYSTGSYNIYLRAGTRVPYISNIPNSGQIPFVLYSFLE